MDNQIYAWAGNDKFYYRDVNPINNKPSNNNKYIHAIHNKKTHTPRGRYIKVLITGGKWDDLKVVAPNSKGINDNKPQVLYMAHLFEEDLHTCMKLYRHGVALAYSNVVNDMKNKICNN